ncbi:MAG TPA: oligosaccharide flippase family protein [Terriglobales bacterium]|jgi:O-antigen/teichoic acid export membrane protein|nr:oligosaccharide flippase family protein [Terriglobales bacterium]
MNPAGIWLSLQKRSAFGANVALTAATNLAIGVLGLVTGVLAARLLGPRGRGELAAIQTYPMLLANLAMLGTGPSVVYFSARDPERAGRYLGCAAVIALLASAPLITGGYLAMPLLLSAQSPQIVTAACWYLINVPVVAIMSLWLFVLRGRSDFLPWNALRILPTLAWLAVLASAWLCGIRDPRRVAAVYLAALFALLIPFELIVKRNVPGRFTPEARQFRPMLAYGLPCVASSLPVVLNLRLDQMLMAGLLAPSELGLYVAAVAWSGAINPLMNALSSVLFPKIAAHRAEADRFRSFLHGSRLAVVVALITAPILAAATPWGVVLLFGAKFRGAIKAALILVPAGAVSALNSVIEEGFRGLGKPAAVLYAELAGLLMTIVSLYLLLRPMGIIGASIASLAGYSTVMMSLLLQARWLTHKSPAELLLPSPEDVVEGLKRLATLARSMVLVISRA